MSSFSEIFGIILTEKFVATDWPLFHDAVMRGFLFQLGLTTLSMVLILLSGRILGVMGFEADVSASAYQMLLSLIPSLFVTVIKETFDVMLIAQDITKPMIWVNIVIAAVVYPVAYISIWKTQLGIVGFGIMRTILELIGAVGN